MIPKLRLKFDQPRNGWWDGGTKSGGDFEPTLIETPPMYQNLIPNSGTNWDPLGPKHPGKGNTIKWGCYYLNFWFNCGSGRTWKEAASIAKRKLLHMTKVPCTIEIIWQEE